MSLPSPPYTVFPPKALPSSAAKKLKVAGKLVAAALPMKANAASAAAPKTASSRTDAGKNGANSASPAGAPTTVNGGGVEDGAAGGTEVSFAAFDHATYLAPILLG